QHRILARLESVRDHQLPGQPERALSNVAVDRFRQVQAIIPRNPVLNLVLDSERSRAALRGTERRRQNRNVSTTTKRGNRHLTNINPELGNHRLREQPARLLQRRLRLSLRNRRNNDRRRMMRSTNRLTVLVPMRKPTVAAHLEPGQRHTERVLTPALKPLHHQLVRLEPARLVQRIQPKRKPQLLIRQNERLASLIHIPARRKLDKLPAERPLRKIPPAIARDLPRVPDDIMPPPGSKPKDLNSSHRINHPSQRERGQQPLIQLALRRNRSRAAFTPATPGSTSGTTSSSSSIPTRRRDDSVNIKSDMSCRISAIAIADRRDDFK